MAWDLSTFFFFWRQVYASTLTATHYIYAYAYAELLKKKLQNPKRMPLTNYFILFELCNSLVQAVLITFVWTGRKLEWMKWLDHSECQSRIVRIVEIWTHYPAGCLQGTFKIWQKGNSWFNFGRVVKTVKRICPTSIKRGDRLVDSSPPASRDIFHCQIFLQMSTSLTVHGKRSPIKKGPKLCALRLWKPPKVGEYYV